MEPGTGATGLHARRPQWLTRRSYTAEAVDTEVSPVADVDLDDAVELLTSQIRLIGRGEPVTVVAHSGGPRTDAGGQRRPELVAHAVYLSAYMPASDVPAVAYTRMLYEAFYGDVDPVLADAATGLLTPDGPSAYFE